MQTVEKRPENDRNVEEMRNNEEEWNNNMIAAYLNTEKRNTNSTLSLLHFVSYALMHARTLQLSREKKHTQSKSAQPKITVAEGYTTWHLIRWLSFYSLSHRPLNFRSAALSQDLSAFFSVRFRQWFLGWCIHIHLFPNYLRSHTRSQPSFGYCYYVRINKRFVISSCVLLFSLSFVVVADEFQT